MLAALPGLSFVLIFLFLVATNEWRLAFVKAAVVCGLVVVAITEVLSLLVLVIPQALAMAWALVCVVAAFGVWRRRAELRARWQLVTRSPWRWVAIALVPVLAIIAATGVIAWTAPPNTFDSMAFHMARVAHWAADATIANYPTNILRQLYEPPWPEWAILQLQVLSGSDQLANLVQWFSMVGSVIGASLIAQQLGSPLRGQVFAAIVVATLPMGILQASSTQTDYVVAFWLVCSVSFALSFVARPTAQGAAWFAASLGLAMVTKGTAYIFAAPLVVTIGVWLLIRLRRGLIAPALLMLLIPLAINSGYFIRNEATFHNPLGASKESFQLVNARYSPRAVASNALRDAMLQFGTPNLNLNQWLEIEVEKVHNRVLHIGVSDPATTWPGTSFQVNAVSFDEDYAGDPLQALLAIAAILAAVFIGLRRGPRRLALYGGGLVLAYLLFAAYLRWQPWHSRLELPLLVLSAPLIGAVFARLFNAAVAGIVGTALLVAAVPWVIDNQTRPMVGFELPTAISPQPRYLPVGETIFNTPRTDLYFAKQQTRETPYVNAMARASQMGCRDVALWSGPADWEYPFWVLAKQFNAAARIDQVFVNNESNNAHRFGSTPCVLVTATPGQPPFVQLGGVEFTQIWIQEGVGLYEPTRSG
jgi:hypothetical protein